MRLYHKYYRITNPSSRSSLRGDRRSIYNSILSAISPKKNPGKKAGEMITAFNLLGELNKYIESGHDEFIPLRDIVSARIDGYLSDEAMKYSLSEAIQDLSSSQVRVIRSMLADLGSEVSPEERRLIDEAAERHPSVRRAASRVEAAEKMQEAFRASLERGQLSDTEFLVGPERLEAMKKQQLGAKKELGTESYYPADKKLWKSVQDNLEKRHPSKFIPAKTESRQKEEMAALIKMSHRDTSDSERMRLKKRLQTAISNRWKTAVISEYEKLGGRELSSQEIKLREAQRMKALGVPFPLGPGFFGVVTASRDKSGFRWILFDKEKFVYMQGSSSTKGSASRDVSIAYRILINLANLNQDAGWDNLPDADRRWLNEKRPDLSKRVARILMQHINRRFRINKSTAEWIASSADIPKTSFEGAEDVAQLCKDMTTGETRVIRSPNDDYSIHLKKGKGGKFSFHIEMEDGRISATRQMTESCDNIIRKAHVIGGAMAGGTEVAKAISNPAKLRRLRNSANKHFRIQNPIGGPRLPRQPAEEGDIRELTGMVGIPNNPEDAYRYGFYAGIIRGIDTCGVQNYFKRKRIRSEFQERLLSAAMETTARITGAPVRSVSRKRGRKDSFSVSDVDEELASILADIS